MAAQTGKGSIVQMEKGKPKGKCRKWKLVVSLGRDARTGKYPQKARAFHGTYTQAQKALAEFVAEINGGEVVRRSAWTFKDYADHFCELREKSGDFAASTNDATRGRLRQISRHIGGLKMQEITPTVLETVYLDMRNGKTAHGRPVKGTTLNGIHKAASLMFDHAKKAGVITVNPCDIVDTPSRDTGEKKHLTGAAVQELIGKLDPADSMECAVTLCVTLGLRRGEAVGLSWEDVNFEDHTVTVRHSFDKFGNLKAPKTASGVRILPMSACTEEALRKREAALIEEYGPEAPGYTFLDEEGVARLRPERPVITDNLADRANPNNLSNWWEHHRKDYGMQGYTLHELRHTFLTLAAEKGVHPSVMQKLAGHKNPNITLGIYTHVNMEEKRAAMDALQEVFA